MAVTIRVFWRALKLAFVHETWALLTNYVQVPLGILALLIPCWAVNLALVKFSITFPPSIICMVILFVLLLLAHAVCPTRIFQSICRTLKPACNWSLGTVGIFMTPSFITLSTNTDLSSKQIGIIIAFFFPPLLITWIIDIMVCKIIAKALPFPVDEIYDYEHLDHPGDSSHRGSSPRRSIRIITSSRPHPHLDQDARWVATPSPGPENYRSDRDSSAISLAIDSSSLTEDYPVEKRNENLESTSIQTESPLSKGWSYMSTNSNGLQTTGSSLIRPNDQFTSASQTQYHPDQLGTTLFTRSHSRFPSPSNPQSSRNTLQQGQDPERKKLSDFLLGLNPNFTRHSTNFSHKKSQSLNLINRKTHRKFHSHPIVEKLDKHDFQARARSISLSLSIISRRGHRLTEKEKLLETLNAQNSNRELVEPPQEEQIDEYAQTITGPESGGKDLSLGAIDPEYQSSFSELGLNSERINTRSGSWDSRLELSRQAVGEGGKTPLGDLENQNELIPFPTLDSQFQSATLDSGVPYRKTRRRKIPTESLYYEDSIVDVGLVPEPVSRPSTSPEFELSRKIARIFDLIFYSIFTGIGIVLFYTPGGTDRSQVLFIGVISLIWLVSRRIIPPTWTKILHPALTTSLLASLAIMGLGASRGLTADETFDRFYYDHTYLDLFNPIKGGKVDVMGAGDILESVLDAGTVGLAFTVFDYRRDLYRNFVRIILMIAPNCCLSLIAWPFIARHVGVLPAQAVDFAGRSMSAPLALELLKAVGGNKNLGVVLVYLTGITVSFLRTPMFRLFKIRPASLEAHEDYFTIGATVGAVGGVIGTSSLLKRHRRAAGTATVALVLYAIIMLSLVAVPPIASFVSDLAGISKAESKSSAESD